ncbi:MAG: hypothetical protein H0W28_07545 [Pyrinomonadaceae bacterium]|nr:hypothetical protein [Pyrinomonadaceae bacterium]
MTDSINIRDELEAYDWLPTDGQKIVGLRLVRYAIQMTYQIEQLEKWLARGDDLLSEEYDERREGKWLAKLTEYELLCDMRKAIREKVLDG